MHLVPVFDLSAGALVGILRFVNVWTTWTRLRRGSLRPRRLKVDSLSEFRLSQHVRPILDSGDRTRAVAQAVCEAEPVHELAPITSRSGPSPAGVEKRRERRHTCRQLVSYTADIEDDCHWGLAVNASTGGLALLTKEELKPGTRLALELSALTPAALPGGLPATVRHAHHQAVGSWLHGCEFDTPLTEEQLKKLL
jgi:hypothetical protein